MSLLKEQENLIKEEKDLDSISGNLMPDRIIQRGEMPYSNRRSHNYLLWTPLEERLLPKASVTSLNKYLGTLSRHLEQQINKDLVNILSICRDYIDIYFNSTCTYPVYIKFFDKGSKDIFVLKKLIGDAQAGLSYFGNTVRSEDMKRQITITSLYLREIIASTIGFADVAHFPSQVKDKLSKYKLKAFLLDSHYSLGEDGEIVDGRTMIE